MEPTKKKVGTDPGPCYVPDWERKIVARECILPDIEQLECFDHAWAKKCMARFDSLILGYVPGHPTAGDASPAWVRRSAYYWFGAQDPETGRRVVPEMLLLTAKKSTKTSSMALILLTQWIMSENTDAKAVLLAPTKDPIAKMAYDQIRSVIEETPGLAESYKPAPTSLKVACTEDGSRKELRVVAADKDSIGGTTADYIMLDEMHLLARNKGIKEQMKHIRGARQKKPWATCIICTTHAFKQEKDQWDGMYRTYVDIHEGRMPQPRLMVRYEYPEEYTGDDEKWRDPNTWYIPNPSLGEALDLQYLIDDMKVNEAEGDLAGWTNQHLNIIAGGQGTWSWAGVPYWPGCYDERLAGANIAGLDRIVDRSEALTIGIDGGGMHDFQAVAVLGKERDTHQWLYWGHCWVDEAVITKRPILAESIEYWQGRDEITVSNFGERSRKGNYSTALEELAWLVSHVNGTGGGRLLDRASVALDYHLRQAYIDALTSPHLSAPIQHPQLSTIQQGTNLHGDFEAVAAKCRMGEIVHGNNSLTNWAINNVSMKYRGSYLVAEKEDLAQDKKIDPFMALVFAARLMGASSALYVKPRLWVVPNAASA